jgi:hypothetical protein
MFLGAVDSALRMTLMRYEDPAIQQGMMSLHPCSGLGFVFSLSAE